MFTDEALDHLEALRVRQYQLEIAREWLIARMFLADLVARAWSRYDESVELMPEATTEEEFRARGVARRALQSERPSGSVARSRQ